MAAYDSTTSVARTRAAANASEPRPLRSALSQRRRVMMASKRTSAARSSRPFRRVFATEFRREMHSTSWFCCSRYSGSFWRASASAPPLLCRASRAPRSRSCSTACTTSPRAFSSIAMSSAMYWCSKAAQAWSRTASARFSSARPGRAERAPSAQRSSRPPSEDQASCRASARRIASALNSNLSPLTQITANCSALASSTSTR
mmetsp:Transcript_76614/g.216794  ORF Transcript_76614/g.216794 Transcript_76614/m.216794 type:complete len:203 (-) Transcript_76614:288-896(-)